MSFLTVPILKPVLSSLKELPSSGLSAIVWRGTDLDHLFMVYSVNSIKYSFGLNHAN